MKLSYLLIWFFCLINFAISGVDQPITLFCHGIVDSKVQADRYEQFLQEPKTSFDFPDAQKPVG